jgi:hypothetical protein
MTARARRVSVLGLAALGLATSMLSGCALPIGLYGFFDVG